MVPTLLMIKEADKKIKPQGLWHCDDINSENLELTLKPYRSTQVFCQLCIKY